MTCNIERPTAEALFTKYRTLFENTVLGGAPVIEESNEWYAASLNYAMAEEFYAISDQAWKERDPRQACADNVISMAADDGVYPNAAVPAQGYVKLAGVALAALPAPLDFTIDGQTFVTAVDSTQPSALDATGEGVVRVRALVPGAAGNIAETTGTMTTVVTDVNAVISVCGGTFCNGQDSENIETFRERYVQRLQFQPRATKSWIEQEFLRWPCATRALLREGTCCSCTDCSSTALGSDVNDDSCEDCGCVECGGKMNFYVMFDSSFPSGIATTEVLSEVETWMFGSPQGYGLGQVEIGVCGRVVPVTGVPVNVFVDIVNCATTAQLAAVRDVVTEFFTTVEPSKAISVELLRNSIGRVLDVSDVTVSFDLVDPTVAYGIGKPQTGTQYVFQSACELEPDCDYMLTLNDISVVTTSQAAGGCA